MDKKKINGSLEKLAALLGGEGLPELDRDVALSLLRDIYEEVKFGGQAAGTPAAAIEASEDRSPAEASPEAVAEPSASPVASLFSDEEVIVRHVVEERHVIFSLYGEDEKPAPDEKPVSAEGAVADEQPASDEGPAVDAPTTSDESTVSGEAEAQADEPEPASALASEASEEISPAPLREAVGTGDRFVIIRDLFEGDPQKYDEAMAQLEVFDNLDDALIHIDTNYRWNPASEGARLLMGLLTSKLS